MSETPTPTPNFMPGPDPTATVKTPALLLLIVGAIGVAFRSSGFSLPFSASAWAQYRVVIRE